MSRRWGIVPAAGLGTRIQPLAFSKELLPVGTRRENNTERPRAVSEYLIERMLDAGVTRLCFVISPAKTDIMNYFGGQIGAVDGGLIVDCDFCARISDGDGGAVPLACGFGDFRLRDCSA